MDGATEIVFGVAGATGVPMPTWPGAFWGSFSGAFSTGSFLGGVVMGSPDFAGVVAEVVTEPQPPSQHELPPRANEPRSRLKRPPCD